MKTASSAKPPEETRPSAPADLFSLPAPSFVEAFAKALGLSDDELTEREIDVLKLIAAGNGNKQIADELSISEATVKSRVTNILSKLAANDRAHAVTIGLKRGIIDLDNSQK